MKESQIRKRAIEELEKDGWFCWYPYKSRYKKEQDIFGVYDLIAVQEFVLRFIQLTSYDNISARIKKIEAFLHKTGAKIQSEVWGWNEKKKEFKIVQF